MKTPTQMDHSIEMDEHECVRSNESVWVHTTHENSQRTPI